MKSKLKNTITFLIGWPLSIVALYFIIRTFLPKFNEISHLLTSINIPLLIIGIACFLSYYFLRSLLWQKILDNSGYTLPYYESAYLWATSEFKRYIPGNVWSFLGRSFLFSEKGVTKKDIARFLVVELQIVLVGFILISFLSLPYVSQLFPVLGQIPYLYLIVIALAATGLLCYIFHPDLIHFLPDKLRKSLLYLMPGFRPEINFQLLFLGVLAVFCLGLGYYFSIASMVFLYPRWIIWLTGFFIFSFLVGILSFITPTGLGVREGSITLGLSRMIPLSTAGFVSVFARIILVASEIIFILLMLAAHTLGKKISSKLLSFTLRHKFELVLGIFILLFCLYFVPVSILRHDHFYTGRFDLGNMDQTVWNTRHGRIFQFTNPDGINITSRLAYHADFILILLAPLYFIWESPKMLLLVQTIIVSLGAIFVYLLACKVFSNQFPAVGSQKSVFQSSVSQTDKLTTDPNSVGAENKKLKTDNQTKFLALTLSFSYLMNPGLQWSILYDFHAVTLATTFLLAAFYFMFTKRYRWFTVFALLAAITKEQVWIPVGMMGLYIIISNVKCQSRLNRDQMSRLRQGFNGQANAKSIIKVFSSINNRKIIYFGLTVFILSALAFYYLVWHAIPGAASTDSHFALAYFREANESPFGIIKNIILSPQQNIRKFFLPERINYLRGLFEPLGYLPLMSPWYLLFPAADLLLNFLGDKPELHQIYYQYSAVITPFLYIATIFGVSHLLKLFRGLPAGILAGYIIYTVIIGGYIHGPLPWTRQPNMAMLTKPQQDREYIIESLSKISPEYKVTSTNNLGAHLTHRQHLYTLPHGADSADYIAFLIRPNSPGQEISLVTRLRKDPNYEITAEKGGFVVFKKKYHE